MLNKEISDIVKKLRDAYYGIAGVEAPTLIPSGGSLAESVGAFPAFYIQGNYCAKSVAGLCTPCFYSKFPNPNISREILEESIYSQCKYILDNFEELVLNNQYGKIGVNCDNLKYKEKEPVAVIISPTGSYFSEYEFSRNIRIKILKELVEKGEKYKVDIILHIEAHAEDVLASEEYLKNSEELDLLRQLNTKVIMGFESSDEFTRNVLYNKNLKLETYERAVSILKQFGLDVGSFVFCGLAPHNNIESKQDMLNTVKYLKKLQVFPVLMFPNIQPFTIPEVLYVNDEFDLIEPLTVLSAVYESLDLIYENESNPYWLIPEPVGGPPMPMFNIFYNRKACVTSEVTNRVLHELLIELRLTRNIVQFKKRFELIMNSDEYQKYEDMLSIEQKKTLTIEKKVQMMIATLNFLLERYIREQRPALDKIEMNTQNEMYNKINERGDENEFANKKGIN